jgi:hypothetical protein
MKIGIFVLMYGDFPQLHQRLLSGLTSTKWPEGHEYNRRVWANQVPDHPLRQVLAPSAMPGNTILRVHSDNTPKYLAMREMFAEAKTSCWDWVVWLDDDTALPDSAWLKHTLLHIREHPDARYLGQPWHVHHLSGQWEFIQKAKWYKGKPPQMIKGKPGIEFAQGAYWWLRGDVLRELDWPDERLSHNGGDTLLGEAIRQQGWKLSNFWAGVVPNFARRRGRHEAPAGCLDPKARR